MSIYCSTFPITIIKSSPLDSVKVTWSLQSAKSNNRSLQASFGLLFEWPFKTCFTVFNLIFGENADNQSVLTVSLCTPTELPLRCRRPYCAAIATLWRPHCTLLRMPWHHQATAFVLSMFKVCAIVWCSMPPHNVCLWCHCIAATMLAIVLCAPRRSAFFLDAVRTLLWCDGF